MIRCPNTDRPVPTDLKIEEAALRNIVLTGQSLDCPACHERHEFSGDDVFFAPEDSQSSPGVQPVNARSGGARAAERS